MCIRQIKYVSSDIRARISKFKVLSLLARNLSDQPSSKSYFIQTSNEISNSIALDEPPTNNREQCPASPKYEHLPNRRKFAADIDFQPVPSITAYFTIVHVNQYKNMKYVGNLFKTVGPMLIKLEFLVLGTKTGGSDNMCFYYSYWETQLYKLVSRYVA